MVLLNINCNQTIAIRGVYEEIQVETFSGQQHALILYLQLILHSVIKHLIKSFVETVAWLRTNWLKFSLDINTKMIRTGKATKGYGKDVSPFTEDVHPSVVTSADFWVRGHLTRFCTSFTSSCSCIDLGGILFIFKPGSGHNIIADTSILELMQN